MSQIFKMKKSLPKISLLLGLGICSSVYAGPYEVEDTSQKRIVFFNITQADGIWFNGDTKDLVNNKSNLRDQLHVARDRMGFFGKTDPWIYRLVYDGAEVRLKEAYIGYEPNDLFAVTLGQRVVPYSFWFRTNTAVVNFLEYSLPVAAFEPGYRNGLMLEFFPDPYVFSFMVFGPECDNTIQGSQVKGHTPLAANARFVFAPYHSEKKVIHFAMAGIYQDNDSKGRFRFRSFPEVQTHQNFGLVDTKYFFQCKNFFGLEGEFAFILNSFLLEGEFYQTTVNRSAPSARFGGYSVCADYFLTGEHYIYDRKNADISDISKIRHWFGTWQLAARYTYLGLTSGTVRGGRERDYELGVNWNINENFRLMLNYIYIDTFPSENGLNRQVNVLALRCQLTAQSL